LLNEKVKSIQIGRLRGLAEAKGVGAGQEADSHAHLPANAFVSDDAGIAMCSRDHLSQLAAFIHKITSAL
jgi:hypothetical protein